jgi:hypothetical protein
MALLDLEQNYSFSRYFDLGVEAGDLAAEFGYSFKRTKLLRPQVS